MGVECEVLPLWTAAQAVRSHATGQTSNHGLKTVPRRSLWGRDGGSKGKQQGDHRPSPAEIIDGKRSKTARQQGLRS